MGINQQEIVYLAGGCFWCLEALFKCLSGLGVTEVVSGYMGGQVKSPTYAQVCEGNTGHAEVVKVVYHPEQIDFNDILNYFFRFHDPTMLNRQGNDVGSQYRSAIFYTNKIQRAKAKEIIQRLEEERVFSGAIVTELVKEAPFYRAEDHHQDYFALHGNDPYCVYVIAPKVAKLTKEFEN